MATTTQSQNLDRRETAGLIGSDKVEGTPVYCDSHWADRTHHARKCRPSDKASRRVGTVGGRIMKIIRERLFAAPWAVRRAEERRERGIVAVSAARASS
jgi:hypothetical protein